MIETQPSGRTNHHSTQVVFDAAALNHVSQHAAGETMMLLMRYGINHDIAVSYGDDKVRLKPWMRRDREPIRPLTLSCKARSPQHQKAKNATSEIGRKHHLHKSARVCKTMARAATLDVATGI